MNDPEKIDKYFRERFALPSEMVFLYSRFWQLETWLRQMVYVELRSFKADWEDFLPKNKRKDPLQKDKRLTHMATSQQNLLSYVTFGELWEIIQNNHLWTCFSVYFPPKDILEAKLKELTQIRHRVAHFREPHSDDLRRVEQFFRDIDQQFWKFCTSYNNTHGFGRDANNPLVNRFSKIDRSVVDVTIEFTIRPWVDTETIKIPPVAEPGVIYFVRLVALEQRKFEYNEILKFTKKNHSNCIHIMLDKFCMVLEITYPSILSFDTIGNSIQEFHKIATNSARRKGAREDEAEKVAANWPEYVLPPSNPLTFLCPDMPCSFLGV